MNFELVNLYHWKGVKKIVPIPPNQQTVNTLFGTDIHSEEEMEDWLSSRRPNLEGKKPSNGEEMSLSRVGTDLYEKVNKYKTKNFFVCFLKILYNHYL